MPRPGSNPCAHSGSLHGLTLAVGFALAAGCAPELPPPTLSGVTPEFGFQGADVPIRILGEGLYPRVGARTSGEVEWDREVQAWLVDGSGESFRLSGVSLLSYEEISATVPEGLEAGYYDLRVLAPSGDAVTLDAAYEVTTTQVDALWLNSEVVIWDIGEYAVLQISAQDAEGQPVQEDLPVTVELSLDVDDATITFADSQTLKDQVLLEGAIGISGRLDATGTGFFAFTADREAKVTVTVGPSEPGSRVASDSDSLSFAPGPVSQVRVTLPEQRFTAGESFDLLLELLDEAGNPTDTTQAALFIQESCPGGTYSEQINVIGATTLSVAVTASTNLECEENTIIVGGVAEGQTFSGASEPFQVSPGEPDHLAVIASPSSVVAGEESLIVVVTARDAWGNLVEDYPSTVRLWDSAGGLDPELNLGLQSCTPMDTGLAIAFCEATLWKSAEEVTITARDVNALEGVSNSFAVTAGALNTVELEVDSVLVTAGESFSAVVRPLDVESNVIPTEPDELGLVSFEDDQGPASCTRDPLDRDLYDGARYDCVLTVADGADALSVSLVSPELALSDLSAAFAVINGPLAVIEVDVDGVESLSAGETMEVTITGYDAYENRYTEGSDREVDLWDDSGSLSFVSGATSVGLDADAQVSTTLKFTTAQADNQIYAGLADLALGSSEPFDVLAGDLTDLVISLDATWTWVDEPASVSVQALDAFGNLVESFDEQVTVSSSSGLGPDLSSDDWVSGVLDLGFVFEEAGLEDTLVLVRGGAEVAVSASLDVLDPDCPDGPEAALTVAGDNPATLCLSGSSTALTAISAAGSVAGAEALHTYHFDDGDGSWTRSDEQAITTRWTDEGGYRVRLVVADASACGDIASAELYVAEADGAPAGPVTLSLDDDTLNTGVDAAAVTVSALDCSGDPANGTLLVWANLGRLLDGETSTLEETGSGLALEIVDGEADLSWSMLAERYDGEALLRAGVATGAAYGEVSATVTGDQVRPRVLTMTPSGTWSDPIEEIALRLSEPIAEDSIDRNPATLTSRTGESVSLSDISLSSDRQTLTLALAAAFTPGELILTVPAELRDDAGNRLNGAWDDGSAPSDFEAELGAVDSSARDVTSCAPEQTTFRPDGDDPGLTGSEEADQVTVEAYATDRPAWWRLEVTDAEGALVSLDRVAADGSIAPLSWDGRGLDGIIVAEGLYDIAITAEDGYWNTGATCTTSVTVAHRILGVP